MRNHLYIAVDNTQLDTVREHNVNALRNALELNLWWAAFWLELAKMNLRLAEVLSGK